MDDQTAATLSTMSDDGHTPRGNFPLPRELRDHIYSYLLDSVHTRQVRLKDSTAITDRAGNGYHFHTSILGVNRAIHDESEEFLYKNNIFIVVSIEWPNFDARVDGQPTYFQRLMSPVVTDTYAARMKQHTLRLHIAKNMEPIAGGASAARSSKIPQYSVLLVANEIRAFCFSLRFRIGAMHSFAVVVADDPAPRTQLTLIGVNASYQKFKPPSLKVEFRDNQFRVADSDLQRHLLEPLRTIVSPSLQVSLMGALRLPEDLDIGRIKLAMGPSVVSYQTLAWYFFDVMVGGKHLADAAVIWGEHQVALRLYCTFADQVSQWISSVVSHGSDVVMHSLSALRLDILISLAYLYVKIGDMETLTYACTDLKDLLDSLKAQTDPTIDGSIEQARARLRHILLLEELFTFDSKKITSVRVKTVREVTELLSEHSDGLYTHHDLQILEAVENKEDPATNHLLRELCSACKLEPVISAVHRSIDLPQKPDHIVGLQNINVLRGLSADVKEKINGMQRKFRAQVTDWDSLTEHQAGRSALA